MAWPAVLGAVAGAVAGPAMDSVIGAVQANEQWQRSKHVANRQMASARFLAENQPSWAMEGLRKAGLNPILAATRGFPSAEFAPRSPAPAPSQGRFGAAPSSAVQLQKLSPELSVLDSLVRRSRSEADAAFYSVGKEKASAEREFQSAKSEEERVAQLREMTELIRQQQLATAAQRKRTEVQTVLDQADIPSAKALEEMFRDDPWMRKILTILKEVR